MPIKETTPKKAIQRSIDNRLERIQRAIINILMYAGEEVVKYARDPNRKRYTDRTGNLTSSIGYVVLRDGNPVHISDFQQIAGKEKPTAGSLTGSKRGRAFLQSLIEQNRNGLVLIVVAGMPYAAYVEAKGYDVLGSAEDEAETIVKRMIGKLRF